MYDYEGTINKFLIDDKGSTLIAVFGLPPLAHENDGTRAVLAGKFLVDSLSKIDMAASVGISSGIGAFVEMACKCAPPLTFGILLYNSLLRSFWTPR